MCELTSDALQHIGPNRALPTLGGTAGKADSTAHVTALSLTLLDVYTLEFQLQQTLKYLHINM